MSTIIRELTDIQGVEVSAPTENPFTASGLEVFATDAAYEVVRPTPGAGEFYFNSTYGAVRVYNGTAWQFDKTTFTAQTDAASTGANVDLAPNTTDQIIRFTHGSLTSIRSINPANQRLLYLYNGQASNGITLKNEDAGATAANRIKCGLDYVIQTGQLVTLIYDEDQSRWLIASKPITGLESFVDDAAYVTAHGPAVAGSRYWNTTSTVVREHDGTAWFNNRVAFETEVNAALTGSDQDLVPAKKQIIKLTNASLSSIRGVSPLILQYLILVNGTGATISIKNESSGASATTRILTGTGVDLSVKDGASIILAYDSDSARWRVTGGSGSGSGSGGGLNVCLSPNDTAGQYSASLGYGWYSSAATAASTTTTASECPLAPVVTTAIKITRTTVGSYEEYRWKMPTALKSNTIPISWLQQVQTGAVSGEFKVDVYVYTDSTYTDGTKTRKNLRSDSSSVTSIPAYNGFFGSGNAISFDTGTEDYYGMRVTRVSGTNWISIVNVKIGPGDNGIAGADGEYETVSTYTIGATTTAPTPGTGATFLRNTYRAGRWAIIRYEFRQTAAGSAGAGDYLLPLPTGLAIDYTRAGAIPTTAAGDIGKGTINNGSTYYEASGYLLNFGAYINKIFIQYANEATAATIWGGGGTSLATATVILSLTVRVPIVGWDDAVLVGPNTITEFVSDNGTSDVFTNTGSTVPSIAGSTGSTSRDHVFNYPKQEEDIVIVELNVGGNGWSIASQVTPYVLGTSSYEFGIQGYWANATTFRVVFGNGGLYPNGGLGAVSPNTWALASTWKYRIRKAKAGIPAGIQHGVLDGSAQLYRAGYAPGLTTGATIGAGYVGEVISASPGSAIAYAGSGIGTNVASITLTPGVWTVSGSVQLTATALSGGVYSFAAITLNPGGTADDFKSASQINITPSPSSNLSVVTPVRIISVSANTPVYLLGQLGYSSATGTYAVTSRIQAIRIA